MNILKYSNGWGHLIMSIFMVCVGIGLILIPNIPSSAQGVGIGLILAVQTAWFVPGAAKQIATELAKVMPLPLAQTITDAITPAQTTPTVAADMDATQKIPVVSKP